jgi:hypothetical protein
MPKISALPASGPLVGTELVPIVQGGVTDRTTTQDIANLGVAGGWIVAATPVAGTLRLVATTAGYDVVQVQDNGNLNMQWGVGSAWDLLVAGTPQLQFTWAVPGCSMHLFNLTIFTIDTAGLGAFTVDGTSNTLTFSGFTTTFMQVTGLNPAFWGGPGTPADVGTAIDRIAAVVSAGGGTPIP